MSFIINSTDRIIFKSFDVSKEALGIYRIFYSLFLLLTGVPIFLWIKNFPSAFYHPPLVSLGSFFTKFPPYWFLMFISVSICLLSIFLLFGYKTGLVSLLLSLFILIGKSFAYSFGKIDHDFLIWLIPLVMAFSQWGKAYSIDSKKNNDDKNYYRSNYEDSWPVSLLALILCLAMFSAGLPKILAGWLDTSTQAVRAYLLSSYYETGRQNFLAPLFLKLNSPLIWEFFDYATVAFEITFLFVFIRPDLFKKYIFCVIMFHLLNLLMLNITFYINSILYLLFIDWNMLLNFLRKYKVLSYIGRLINVKNLVVVSIGYLAFFFIFLKENSRESAFIVSPLKSLMKVLNLNPSLIGAGVIFLAVFLSILNAIYFIRNKKFRSISERSL